MLQNFYDFNLGESIKKLLDEKNMTIEELAEMIKMPVYDLSFFIENPENFEQDTIDAIAKAFGMGTNKLLLLSATPLERHADDEDKKEAFNKLRLCFIRIDELIHPQKK